MQFPARALNVMCCAEPQCAAVGVWDITSWETPIRKAKGCIRYTASIRIRSYGTVKSSAFSAFCTQEIFTAFTGEADDVRRVEFGLDFVVTLRCSDFFVFLRCSDFFVFCAVAIFLCFAL